MKLLFSGIILIFLFIGCKGETGPVGPAGNDGNNGNANVQIIEFSFTSFQLTQYSNDSRVYFITKTFPELVTDDMAILIYFKGTSTSWSQLPMSDPTWPFSITYYFNVPSLSVEIRTDEGDARSKLVLAFGGTNFDCKMILIPPGANKKEVNELLNF
jgi:hypothetical protein